MRKRRTNGRDRTVGRNPPNDTRFRKGASGNPKGRPKGSRNIRTLLMEAARNQLCITINGQRRRISTAQATALQLAFKAARGRSERAIADFLDRIDEIETQAAAAKPAPFPLSAVDVEVLKATFARMKQCEQVDPCRSK